MALATKSRSPVAQLFKINFSDGTLPRHSSIRTYSNNESNLELIKFDLIILVTGYENDY